MNPRAFRNSSLQVPSVKSRRTIKTLANTRTGLLLAFMAVMTTMLFAASFAAAQTETVLHGFNNTTDYGFPTAPLIADAAGNLYGTASFGGPGAHGGVFELSPPAVSGGSWTESMLLTFDDGPDGGAPQPGLIMDASGALYGTTIGGGAGYGVVFQLEPPAVQGGAWTENILHTFSANEGNSPIGGLIFGPGTLYGTTAAGGPGRGGNVFSLTPPAISGDPWTLTVLHNFQSTTNNAGGCGPNTNVTLGPNGSLFGTTSYCGANGGGVVFKLSPPANGNTGWQETVLHTFGTPNTLGDGYDPQGGVIVGPGGVLFGTTLSGGSNYGGIAYELFPPATSGGAWTEQILISFTGGTVGYQAWGNLVLNSKGALYGVTTAANVYKLTPPAVSGDPWTETVLVTFNGSNGSAPVAGVLQYKGALYGTTSTGGPNGFGTVYKVTF